MNAFTQFNGYDTRFLGTPFKVSLPGLSGEMLDYVARISDNNEYVLPYGNYCVVQHSERRFPILNASNIRADLFKEIPRKVIGNDWNKDPRIPENSQFGKELYKSPKSDFDRGHMVKREDVQWGREEADAIEASRSTFFYTNAVPQHPRLNQRLWRKLEDYILHSEAVAHQLRINMFTGPVLSPDDPLFVTPIDGIYIQLPTLFWKMVYYTKPDDQLYRVAFLMGQQDLLFEDGMIRDSFPKSGDEWFLQFEHGGTFQVNIDTIEGLTGLSFAQALDPKQDQRPVELVLEEVQLPGGREGETIEQIMGLVL